MTISEISAEEDEEALIMRRLRNASDSLKRGLKGLEYKVCLKWNNFSCSISHPYHFTVCKQRNGSVVWISNFDQFDQMERVRRKADQSRAIRQNIELCEGTISIAGEPSPFKAYVPQDEVIKYRQDQGGNSASAGRLIYKVCDIFTDIAKMIKLLQSCRLNNRSLSLFRIGYGKSFLTMRNFYQIWF